MTDSSGNAGASAAAYAALAGIRAEVLIPAYASEAKAAQIASYGARLIRVPGTREDASAAAVNAAKEIYYASHNWNPYFVAGMKTAAFEIAEELEWQVPDWVIAPVGGGSLLVGLWQGFVEMRERGLTRRVPKLGGVQSECCAPVVTAWREGRHEVGFVARRETAAEGIAIGKPVRGAQILRGLYESGGAAVTVSEFSIWTALECLGRCGVYVEPTSAAAFAGYRALREAGRVRPGERTAIVLTGSGLKATEAIVHRGRTTAAGG
jgi:threonine synthase